MTDSVLIGVGALVRNTAGEILLVKHNYPSYWEGSWILPGGMLQVGETLREAAKREVYEETGLIIEVGAHLITFERIVREKEKVLLHVVYIDFWGEVVRGGELKAGDDVGEARWFTPDEILALQGEIHPDARTILAAAGFLPG